MQLEWQFFDQPGVSLLTRYDTLDIAARSFGDANLERFTWGFNLGLPGGGLLILNHERWWPSKETMWMCWALDWWCPLMAS